MNELDAALYTALKQDAPLTGLLADPPGGLEASVYEGLAPQGSRPPYVIFSEQTTTRAYAHAGRAWDRAIYLVKAVTEGPSAGLAGEIAAAIDELLDDGTLAIAGHAQLCMRHIENVRYREVADGKQHVHRGALYRIHVQ